MLGIDVESAQIETAGIESQANCTESFHGKPLEPHELAEYFRCVVARQKKENLLDPVDYGTVEKVKYLHKANATVSFRDISFSIRAKRREQVILEPISGIINPSELLAIMGPSGCGKSTLLDILADKKTGSYTGSVFLNGHLRDKFYHIITAYIPQTDVMPEQWTVREVRKQTFILKQIALV
jgi:ABC-type transport system involved in cytochrome bd biosynthesis fused ATPase/permease subunit